MGGKGCCIFLGIIIILLILSVAYGKLFPSSERQSESGSERQSLFPPSWESESQSERQSLFPPLSPGQHHPQCPSTKEYVDSNQPPQPPAPPSETWSGTWRGYYHQYGQRHNVCEFSLTFQNGE